MTRILFGIALFLGATVGAYGQTRPALDASVVRTVDRLYPGFTEILEHGDAEALTRLARVLSDRPSAESLSVLLWMLKHCPSWPLDGNAVTQMAATIRVVGKLPLAELRDALVDTNADQRLAAVFLLGDRALIDPSRDAATRMAEIRALGRLRGNEAVPAITRVLEPPFRETFELSTAVESLAQLGDAAALPALERFARSSAPEAVRTAAVAAYIDIAKAPDPGAHVRRLLWEQPDTRLEKDVMAQGNAALPHVWRALASPSRDDQRAAAALLGWFRDTRSIQPILSALDGGTGALTREQLIFDLNMILLTEAPLATLPDRNTLAALHLEWLREQLAAGPLDNRMRALVTPKEPVLVHPGGLVAPFSVAWGSTTATLASSPEAFSEATRGGRPAIAFHAIRASNDVARVATTVYLPQGGTTNQSWISLYRRQGERWVPLPVPGQPVVRRMLNQPNLLPTINRNYGADHPLKILRLDLTMERVRVDFDHRLALGLNENIEKPGYSSPLDAGYLPLLDRYRRDPLPSVRYAAEFEATRVTKRPNLSVWIDALELSAEPRVRQLAVEMLAEYAYPRFRADGRPLAGPARTPLVNAALAPEAVNAVLLPKQPPDLQSIVDVREWDRFGLVDLRFGSGPRAETGYSMLFERRGTRWVFLCVVGSWIS